MSAALSSGSENGKDEVAMEGFVELLVLYR